MENDLLRKIESLINQYQKDHKGERPLYVVLSPDENKEVILQIRKQTGLNEDQIVTSYKDVKLAQHPSMMNGKMYVTNELPETGS